MTDTKKTKKAPRKTRRSALKIGQIEKALRATGGFVTYAAKQLGVTHQAVTKRIKASPRLQQVQDEVREGYLDLTEHSLLKKVKDEDLGAIIFYLKCQGKGRGYIEKPKDEKSANEILQPQIIEIVMQDARKTE